MVHNINCLCHQQLTHVCIRHWYFSKLCKETIYEGRYLKVDSDPKWKTQNSNLGTNKETFNTELYAVGEALEIILKNGRLGREATRQQAEPC